jgi:hypothetical protein
MSSDRPSFMPRRPAVILSPQEIERRQARFAAVLARNKLRGRPGEDPPTAEPAPVEPRAKGPPMAGGAAAMLSFDEAE